MMNVNVPTYYYFYFDVYKQSLLVHGKKHLNQIRRNISINIYYRSIYTWWVIILV